MALRKDLANLTINLDMESEALIRSANRSARHIASLGKSGGSAERGFSMLQGRVGGLASALAGLGMPQPLMAMTALSGAARSLSPMLAPITAGITSLGARLGTSSGGLAAAASGASAAIAGIATSSAALAAGAAVAGPAALLAGFGALTKVLVSSTASLDALAKASKALQMPSAELRLLRDFGGQQGWREGAENLIIRMMDRSLIDARRGTQRKVDAFAIAGIDIHLTQSKWDQLQSIFSGLSRLDPAPQMRAAMEIFGPRYAGQAIQALDGWEETITRIQRHRDLTPYVDLSGVEELHNRSADLKVRWESLKDTFKIALIPIGEGTIKAVEMVLWYVGQIPKAWRGIKGMFSGSELEEEANRVRNAVSGALDPEAFADSAAQVEQILAKSKSAFATLREEVEALRRGMTSNTFTQAKHNEAISLAVDKFYALSDPVREYQEGLRQILELQQMGAISYEQTQAATEKITAPLLAAGDAIRATLSPLDEVKGKLEEIAAVAKGHMVDGVKIGGLTDSEALRASRKAISDYVSSAATDFAGLLEFYRKNKSLFSDPAWSDPLQRLITASYDARTPLENLNRQLENIELAFSDGYLSIDLYRDAVRQLVEGFQPASASLEEVSAKLVNMSKIGTQFGTEELLGITQSLQPFERLAAIMDGMLLGDLDPSRALSGINTLFGQLQDEVFQLEEALLFGEITPMLFEEKLSPLLDGLKEAQWLAANVFGATLDMGSEWHRMNQRMLEEQNRQMREYEKDMAAMAAQMEPAALGSVHWLDSFDMGGGAAGVASASQIAGVLATAQAISRKPEEETAKNTRLTVERLDRLVTITERNIGGLL